MTVLSSDPHERGRDTPIGSSRSVIADHLHADAAQPARLERIARGGRRGCNVKNHEISAYAFVGERESGTLVICIDMMPPTDELPGVPSAVRPAGRR